MRRLVPLVLAIATACASATEGNDRVPEGKDGECASCHMPEFRGAARHPGKKPPTCAVCHAQTGWHPTKLDHRWPLDGAHEKADCFGCHRGDPPKFRGTKKECVDCHRDDYDRAKNHEKKPTTCDDCHTTTSWKERRKKGGATRKTNG
jgi:hypothetical protein